MELHNGKMLMEQLNTQDKMEQKVLFYGVLVEVEDPLRLGLKIQAINL